jgi:PAS domain S-box-containing protein
MSEQFERVAKALARPEVGAVSELRALKVVPASGWLLGGTLSKGSWLLVAFVLIALSLPLPDKASWGVKAILFVLIAYLLYVVALEVSSRLFTKVYDRAPFRAVRIAVNVVAVSALLYFSLGARSYFWFLYSLPILQAGIYLHQRAAMLTACAVIASYWLICLTAGGVGAADYALVTSNCLALLLLAAALRRLLDAARKARQAEFERMNDLRLTALDIAVEMNEKGVLKTTIQRAVQLLGARGGGVYEYDSESEVLEVAADWDSGGKQSIVGHRLQKGEGMAGRVAASGQPMIVDDYRTWPHRCPDLEPDLFRAVVEVPLVDKGGITGVLYVTDDAEGRTFTETDQQTLALLASHAAIIISNVKTFEESRHNITQLELLNRISEKVSLAGTVEEVLKITLAEALEAVGARDGSIMVFDPKTGELEIKAWMVDGEFWNSTLHKRFNPNEGIAGHVASTLAPHNCRDTERDPFYAPSHTGRRLRSMLSVPIFSKDKLLCIINADSLEPNIFEDEDVRLFSMVGSHIAAAVESVKLRELGVSLSSLPLEGLYAKIVESGYTLAGTDSVTLFVRSDDGEEVVRVATYPPGVEAGWGDARPDGLARLVLQTGNEIAIDDVQNDERVKKSVRQHGLRSLLGIPVKARSDGSDGSEPRTIGALFAGTRKARTFDAHEVQLLYTLANQAAAAIMQARLYKAVLQERDQLNKNLSFKESLLASAIDAVIAIDREGRITEFNTSAEKTLGYLKGEVLGKDVSFLYASEEDARDIMRRLRDPRNKRRLIDYYTYARAKSRELIPVRLSAYLLEGGSVGFFRDQRTVEAIRRHNEHLGGLLAAGRALTESKDLAEILETTVKGAAQTLKADLVSLYSYDPRAGTFSPTPAAQVPPVRVPASVPPPNLGGLIAAGDVHFSNDAQEDDLVGKEFARATGLRAVIAGPLRVRESVVGVMLCGYAEQRHFSDEEQVMVRLFMSDAAIAIETARIYEELHGDAATLKELYKVSLSLTTELSFKDALQMLLDRACKMTRARYGALGILSPSGKIHPFVHSGVDEELAKRLSPPSAHGGMLGRLLHPEEILNVEDVRKSTYFTTFKHEEHPEITSFLGRAIVIGGQGVGNIYLGNKEGAAKFTARDRDVLGFLANQVSSIKQVFDAQEAASAKLAITIASMLLKQLAHAAREVGSHLASQLLTLEGTVPPGPHKENLDRAVADIRLLDTYILNIQSDIEKQLTEVVVLNKLFYDIARRPGFSSKLEIDIPTALWVKGNRLLLELACSILIENAVKAVEKAGGHGIVSVKCELSDREVLGTVTDTGCGIPKDMAPGLFAGPVGNRNNMKRYGSTLVGMIMRLHGGYIGVQSTRRGETIIEFRLPKGRG